MPWQVENLRLTAFPGPSTQITDVTWWADLIGELPETNVSRPRQGIRQQSGSFAGNKLSLTIQPGRINWLLNLSSDEEVPLEGLPVIGQFSELVNTFSSLMRHWFEFETCPSLQRIAFGAVLLQPVDNRVAGYRQLFEYLPSVNLDVEGISDFLYQINRPRESQSGVADLRINRLTKWSVIGWQVVTMPMPSMPHVFTQTPDLFACRLELDINTVPDFRQEISREQLPNIFQELIEFGSEIAEEGDRP